MKQTLLPASMTRRKGFTLVEMSVVMAIILVVGVLLTPTFKKGMDRARSVKCASNLRTIGMGYIQYLNENEGVAPVDAWTWPNWIYNLMPYVMGASEFDKLYHSNKPLPILGCPKSQLVRRDYWYTDYAINLYALSTPAAPNTIKPLVQSHDATQMLLACDFVNNERIASLAKYGLYQSRATELFRHFNRANAVFLDGHVGTIETADMKSDLFQPSF